MNKTQAVEFIRGIKGYCEIVRKMSKGGTLGYLKNLREQKIQREDILVEKLNIAHDEIIEIDKWVEELEQ